MRQYIGARYTTKIYENSLDPGSCEWEPGVVYEPLTIVSYQNSSYLSRTTVPANAGAPTVATQYWAQTGFYNGQIALLQSEIDAFADEITTKRLHAVNDIDSEHPPIEITNYGGQGISAEDQRAFTVHHYTDGSLARLDNVGSSPALELVNAHNATRRADKPSTYHGDGEYMRMIVQEDYDGDDNWQQQNIGILDKNGDIWRSGYDNTGNPARNHTFTIETNKLDGGTWAYKIATTNHNDYFLVCTDGGDAFLNLQRNGTNSFKLSAPVMGEAQIAASGASLVARPLEVNLNVALGGVIKFNIAGVSYYPTLDNRVCTSNARPTTGLYNGITYKEVDTHKIIWWYENHWYDAMGTQLS